VWQQILFASIAAFPCRHWHAASPAGSEYGFALIRVACGDADQLPGMIGFGPDLRAAAGLVNCLAGFKKNQNRLLVFVDRRAVVGLTAATILFFASADGESPYRTFLTKGLR
jgi:hypothetical protein